jgi:hypothetical protein
LAHALTLLGFQAILKALIKVAGHAFSPLCNFGNHSHQNICCPDGMLKMTLVDLAGQRQANDPGQLTAFAHAP